MTSRSACSFRRAGRWSWSRSKTRRRSGRRRSRSRVLAEELGFDSLWVYDHFHNVPLPAHETMFECWTTIAAISQLTSRIKLGQMVGCAPYRNPGLLAKITSNIDVMSGGRLDLGCRRGLVRARVQRIRLRLHEGLRPHPAACARPSRSSRRCGPSPTSAIRDRTSRSMARSAIRSRCNSRIPRSSSAAVASSSRCESSRATPTCRTSGASRTSGSTRPRCCSSTARTSAATTTRSARRSRPRCSSARPSRRSLDAGTRSFWGEPAESWRAGNLVGTPEQVAEKDAGLRRPRVHGLLPVVQRLPRHRDAPAVRAGGRRPPLVRFVELGEPLGCRFQEGRVQVGILLEQAPEVLAVDHVDRHVGLRNNRRVARPIE